jgi:wyosine [tRNA(Phe)-imidazoG37] synthetase (radical SAM superfamily)
MSEKPHLPPPSAISDHRRQWRDCLYVYPVISRRAGGMSLGVNLNPARACSYSCVYCQIDRRTPRNLDRVDLQTLRTELADVLTIAAGGEIWSDPRFAQAPQPLRRLNDIAFSGDGEPTCLGEFDRAVAVAAEEKARLKLPDVKLVVITNAAHLQEPQVLRAYPILREHNGEIWAKLDAGTQQQFEQINRPQGGRSLETITENIIAAGREMPIVVQSLFLRLRGEAPGPDQIDAYIQRVRHILEAGAKIRYIQVHTIARSPAEPFVAYLPEEPLREIADRIDQALPVDVKVYPGADAPPIGKSPA